MENTINQFAMMTVACTISISSVGCAALPWRAKKAKNTMTASQYAEQAVANNLYNNDVDFSQDYQSSPATAHSYAAPPPRAASALGGGSASSSSGCCH